MSNSYTKIFLHLVWATWDRLPLITPAIQERVYAALRQKCFDLKCLPLAIGGVADHVHVLLQLHPTLAIAILVKDLKGSTSHLVTHAMTPSRPFRWQGAYSAFSVGPDALPALQRYIERQTEHHTAGDTPLQWEPRTDAGRQQGREASGFPIDDS